MSRGKIRVQLYRLMQMSERFIVGLLRSVLRVNTIALHNGIAAMQHCGFVERGGWYSLELLRESDQFVERAYTKTRLVSRDVSTIETCIRNPWRAFAGTFCQSLQLS